MNLPPIKDLVKDNNVSFNRFKSGNLFYLISHHHSVGQFIYHDVYEFPVPISDCGEAEMKKQDKAILYMRWINKSIKDGTFKKL